MNFPSESPTEHEDDHLVVELDSAAPVAWVVSMQPCDTCGRIVVAAVCDRLATAAHVPFQIAVEYATAAQRA